MDLSALKPCDLWTSLCHPMPGLMQKGLGRQRDAQPSRYHLTALIYCTHGANLPFSDRLKYTLTSELTLVSIFSQAGRFFSSSFQLRTWTAEAFLAFRGFKRLLSLKARSLDDTISISTVCCCNLEDLYLVIHSAHCRAPWGPAECCCSSSDVH